MLNLGQADLQACLATVHAISTACMTTDGFARAGVANLRRLVPGDLTTLSTCDLPTGHRTVVSDVPGAIPKAAIEAFDRHFATHPAVHALRISDLEYDRPIAIDHAMAMPVHVDRTLLVSFVFNRSRRDFSDRERARLEAIRPLLGQLYRLGRAMDVQQRQWAPASDLTSREHEVLRWLAAGKTDRDIADILAISPRTVHKHLQRIYEKLGVETRTAAVVRAMNLPGAG